MCAIPLFVSIPLLVGVTDSEALPFYSLGDFDRDGLLDAYVIGAIGGDRLFRNLGDGTFVDVTRDAGLAEIRGSRAALWQDFDGDGFQDLYVSSRAGRSQLFWNDGAGAFLDVSERAGLCASTPTGERDARWIDYDLDRRPDLWISTRTGDLFLRNGGGGTFEPVELVPLARDRAPATAPSDAALAAASECASAALPLDAERPGSAEERPAHASPGIDARSEPPQRAPHGASASGTSASGASASTLGSPCADALLDVASGSCSLRGSIEPALGLLYPLSTALNVDSAGRVGMGTSSPGASLHVQGLDGLLAIGVLGMGGPLGASGPGTRLMWIPRKAALRAGQVTGDRWDEANIGEGSIALGRDSIASAPQSMAIGQQATATGHHSLALGRNARATAIGAVAVGSASRAAAQDSYAFGDSATALADCSSAFGCHTIARGRYSTAFGVFTFADSLYSAAFGTFNVGGGSTGTWVDSDPLFEIGNGSGTAQRSNAVTVLKNGNVGIGTSAPQFRLEVSGSAAKPGGGSWSVASDARLKKDVRTLDGALDTLLALRGVSFEYRDPAALGELSGRRVGFVAQEVEQVIPDWVEEVGGTKRLTIRGFEALAVEALRELHAENETLRARAAAAEIEVAALRERAGVLDELAARLARVEGALGELRTAAPAERSRD